MQNHTNISQDFHVDKLTRSIENVVTGDSFSTDITLVATSDLRRISPESGWRFNWRNEFNYKERDVYKLTIVNNSSVLQGLMCLQVKEDHVFIHLIESAPFNVGTNKMYAGVSGNLVAFACKLSYQRGHDGYVAFIAKSSLIKHYKHTVGANVLNDRIMIIDTAAAKTLINTYFHNE